MLISGRDLAAAAVAALATYIILVGIPPRLTLLAARAAAEFASPALAERLLESAAGAAGDHPGTVDALRRLASLYRIQGRQPEAFATLMQARYLLERTVGPRHVMVAPVLDDLAAVSVERGDASRAAALQNRALIILTAAYGPDDPHVLLSLEDLADVMRLEGRFDDALRIARRVLAQRKTTREFRSVYVGRALGRIGAIHRERGHLDLAELYLDSALAHLSPTRGGSAVAMDEDAALAVGREAARIFTAAGLLRGQQERFGVARRLLRRSFDLYTGQFDEMARQAEVLSHLAAMYRKEGHRGSALQHLRVGLRLADELPRSPAVGTQLRAELAELCEETGVRRASQPESHADEIWQRACDPGIGKRDSTLGTAEWRRVCPGCG